MKRVLLAVAFVMSLVITGNTANSQMLITPGSENCQKAAQQCEPAISNVGLNVQALESILDRCKRSLPNRIRAKRRRMSITAYCGNNAEARLQLQISIRPMRKCQNVSAIKGVKDSGMRFRMVKHKRTVRLAQSKANPKRNREKSNPNQAHQGRFTNKTQHMLKSNLLKNYLELTSPADTFGNLPDSRGIAGLEGFTKFHKSSTKRFCLKPKSD